MKQFFFNMRVRVIEAIQHLRQFLAWWIYPYPTQEEIDRIEEVQQLRDIVRSRNELYDERAEQLRDALGELMALPISRLRARAEFETFWEDGQWQVSTAICQIGGCCTGKFAFPDERDALIFSAALGVIGYELSMSACSECYNEYMAQCI